MDWNKFICSRGSVEGMSFAKVKLLGVWVRDWAWLENLKIVWTACRMCLLCYIDIILLFWEFHHLSIIYLFTISHRILFLNIEYPIVVIALFLSKWHQVMFLLLMESESGLCAIGFVTVIKSALVLFLNIIGFPASFGSGWRFLGADFF